MDITKDHRRRVRIEGKPDEVRGYMMEVKDAETGERITNVCAVKISLSVDHLNWAELTYHVRDEQGELKRGRDNRALRETVRLPDPEIAVTAIEATWHD